MFFRRVYDSNEKLVEALTRRDVLHSQPIIDAFLKTDRQLFVPEYQLEQAYGDFPLEIGAGQTISQPTTVASMTELLEPEKGQKILDVGSGSGYLSAILGHLTGPTGEVHGTEIRQAVYETGRQNVAKTKLENVHMHYTPDRLGWPRSAPYDRIVVSASTAQVPELLLEQLGSPGVMVIPIEDSLTVVRKDESGRTSQDKHYGYAFVPLVKTA